MNGTPFPVTSGTCGLEYLRWRWGQNRYWFTIIYLECNAIQNFGSEQSKGPLKLK